MLRCDGRFHCPWEEFLATFASELEECSLDALCSEDTADKEAVAAKTSFWVVALGELAIFVGLMAFAMAVKIVPAPKLD